MRVESLLNITFRMTRKLRLMMMMSLYPKGN